MSKTTKDVLNSYNKTAFLYDLMNLVYFFRKDREYRSLLADKLDLKPEHLVLVPCCGTGVDFRYLLEKVKKRGTLVGVDISSEMIRQTKKKMTNGSVDLVRSDIAYMPFRDETLDAVSIAFCLKITPTFKKAIEEIFRVLKPDGKIGVLANHKPTGFLSLPRTILTKVIGEMAKIDFEINLKGHLSKLFTMVEDRKMHGGLVRLLVGEKRQKTTQILDLRI